MSKTSEFAALFRRLRHEGWTVERTGSGHYKCRPPNGGPYVTVATSPSDRRAMLNVKAALRRAAAV